MKRARWNGQMVLIPLLTTAVVALTGVVANLASAAEGSTIERVTNYLSLAVGLLGVMLGVISAGQSKKASKATVDVLESAQRQAEAARMAAQEAGLDADRMYEQFMRSVDIPIEVRFIYAWARLERIMRSVVRDRSGDDLIGRPLGTLISEFIEAVGLASEDKNRLRDLLGIRNSVVHGSKIEADNLELKQGLKELDYYARMASEGNG